jgi:transcriptional regulator with XRE-family HTH domain
VPLSPHRTLGHRIHQARKAAGYKNAESLAVALQVGHRTVQRWEADESEPSISRLREIAALTGEPLSFFIATDLSEEAVA